nr:DUF86 domain-containing protein [uncultured Methanospirillum sp.]
MNSTDVIRELTIALSDWERYESIPKEKFLTDRDTQNMVLHAMFLAIQAGIDAGAWLIATRKIPVKPSSYRETFEILEKYGVLEPDLSSALAALSSFRNVLIHQYSILDLEETWEVLIHEREYLNRFVDILVRSLSS